jgi:hypothetical protein
MYIMTPEPISMAYFLNPSHQIVCLSPYRCQATDRYTCSRGNEYEKQRRIVGHVVFFAVRVSLKESLWVSLPPNR